MCKYVCNTELFVVELKQINTFLLAVRRPVIFFLYIIFLPLSPLTPSVMLQWLLGVLEQMESTEFEGWGAKGWQALMALWHAAWHTCQLLALHTLFKYDLIFILYFILNAPIFIF